MHPTPRTQDRPAGGAARRFVGVLPSTLTRVRRDPPPERVVFAVLCAASLLALYGSLRFGVAAVPASVLLLPVLGGGLLLGRIAMLRLLALVAGCLVWELIALGLRDVRAGNIILLVVSGVALYDFARSREETGLSGLRGDSILVELRERLLQQGELPVLPSPWRGEAVVRPAGGGPFAGDFVVSAITGEGRLLEVVLVDVSGKGVDAGTRALLLSGALGGLLGAAPVGGFLAAANAYLYRQNWDEGFATAVHVVVDLHDGSYVIESAGHPPAAIFTAGNGKWRLSDTEGPALGLLPGMCYGSEVGRLEPGDALLLYTDGLVEVPGRDLFVGIDKLLGEAERLVPRGFDGGGEVLVTAVADGSSDDRGLVLLWRQR